MGVTYLPTAAEYHLTGASGLLLYATLLLSALWTLRRGIKARTSKFFYFTIVALSLFEFPRYLELALAGEYDSRVCYGFHILAGTMFFAAFSVICHQWSGLLSLASYFRVVYGRNALILANAAFALVDIVSIGLCLLSPSLQHYFLSQAFGAITLLEALRNFVYAGFLAYFGVSLVCRFSHYSALSDLPLIGSGGSSSGIGSAIGASSSGLDSSGGSEGGGRVFGRAVLRLTAVLVLVLLCFALRAAMLIAKLALLQQQEQADPTHALAYPTTSPSFPLFGFFFFALTDFVPRVVPASAFMLLMARGRRGAGAGAGAGYPGSRGVSLANNSKSFLPGAASSSSSSSSTASGTASGSGSGLGLGMGLGLGLGLGFGMAASGSGSGAGGDGGEGEDEDFQFVRLAGDDPGSGAGSGSGAGTGAGSGSGFGAGFSLLTELGGLGDESDVESGFGSGGSGSDDELGLGGLDDDDQLITVAFQAQQAHAQGGRGF